MVTSDAGIGNDVQNCGLLVSRKVEQAATAQASPRSRAGRKPSTAGCQATRVCLGSSEASVVLTDCGGVSPCQPAGTWPCPVPVSQGWFYSLLLPCLWVQSSGVLLAVCGSEVTLPLAGMCFWFCRFLKHVPHPWKLVASLPQPGPLLQHLCPVGSCLRKGMLRELCLRGSCLMAAPSVLSALLDPGCSCASPVSSGRVSLLSRSHMGSSAEHMCPPHFLCGSPEQIAGQWLLGLDRVMRVGLHVGVTTALRPESLLCPGVRTVRR